MRDAQTEIFKVLVTAFVDGDMLHSDSLLAGAAVSLQRFDLGCERPRQFVEGPLRAVLLRDGVRVVEAARKGHDRIVCRRHLSS